MSFGTGLAENGRQNKPCDMVKLFALVLAAKLSI